MFGFRRRGRPVAEVQFCESCSRVCTPACRSEARLEQAHTEAPWPLALSR
jgi:hypothetical protein